MDTAVVALGGNALVKPNEKDTDSRQLEIVKKTIEGLEELVRTKKTVLTHGNGPQVGNLYLQQEKSRDRVPPLPLHTCVAMTQGQIGYYLQKTLNGIGIKSASVVTQVVVDSKDPAFENPKKPVGPYYETKREEWDMVKKSGGWRRVVPSPKPLEVIEIEEIKELTDEGFTTVACGGGGIPVVRKKDKLEGVDAVIDKDRASALLGKMLEAKEMYMITNVPHVYRDYGSEDQEKIEEMNSTEAEELLTKGEFGEGSMKPKIESALEFLKSSGEKVVITDVENSSKVLKDEGTKLTR